MDLGSATPQVYVQNEDHFKNALKDETNFSKIPLLNAMDVSQLKDGAMVRFRGMIQDMYGPEFYVDECLAENINTNEKEAKSGRYVDVINCSENQTIDYDSSDNKTQERHVYFVVSIPAENDWVKSVIATNEVSKIKQGTSEPLNNSSKRVLEEDMEIEITSGDFSKKQRVKTDEKVEESKKLVSSKYLMNLPIPDRTGKVCLLKTYKDINLKLNECYEFIGFLSLDPSLSQEASNELDNAMEIQTHHPPPSLVPRIHTIFLRDIKYGNPLVPIFDQTVWDEVSKVRKDLIILLTQLMLGDVLAAEYLLCHLISEVNIRTDLNVLGKFSLNIFNVPNFSNLNFCEEVYKFLELMLVKSHRLDMTIENLNEMSFVPKKDYDSNRVNSGLLQLSANTHLVLDETKLKAGKLNEAGVKAVQSLNNVIKNQSIKYDFGFYPVEFECDIPFLIFSEGKSMLSSDSHIKLKPDEISINTYEQILEAARHFLNPKLLSDVRKYFTLSRMGKYEITDNVNELVQNEFVNMRKNQGGTAEDLHHLLVLSRLICLSYGKTSLDEEIWNNVCKMEQARRERNK